MKDIPLPGHLQRMSFPPRMLDTSSRVYPLTLFPPGRLDT